MMIAFLFLVWGIASMLYASSFRPFQQVFHDRPQLGKLFFYGRENNGFINVGILM